MRAVGAPVLVLTTGPAGPLEWDDAARALGEVLDPVIAAANASVRVAIENTSPMRLDLSFATTLRDTVDLAEQLGAYVCVELNSCWAERGFDATVAGAADRIAHVQCSDARVGSLTTPDRLVPGDGDIPLARRFGALARAGYAGAFEIEMVGPRIEAEGYEPAIRRAVDGSTRYWRGRPVASAGVSRRNDPSATSGPSLGMTAATAGDALCASSAASSANSSYDTTVSGSSAASCITYTSVPGSSAAAASTSSRSNSSNSARRPGWARIVDE